MALITTPSELNRRAELYHQLGMMISAGLSVHQSLAHLQRNPPSLVLRQPIAKWLEQLNQGLTVTEALRSLGKWIPSFDVAMIDAAEKSGRLDACFKLLSVYCRERAEMGRQMISDMIYPVSMFHLAILLFPALDLFKHQNLQRFFLMTAGIALPLYALVFLILYSSQGRHGERWRAMLENILARVPVLGTARQDMAIARLSMALESLLTAGVPIVAAWEMAAAASGSPALHRTVLSWKPQVENGATFSELIPQSGLFPELFANLYHTGEVSGTLDESLKRLQTLYQTEGLRRMKALFKWTAKAVYFSVLLFVAYKIIHYYMGYAQELNDAMDMK